MNSNVILVLLKAAAILAVCLLLVWIKRRKKPATIVTYHFVALMIIGVSVFSFLTPKFSLEIEPEHPIRQIIPLELFIDNKVVINQQKYKDSSVYHKHSMSMAMESPNVSSVKSNAATPIKSAVKPEDSNSILHHSIQVFYLFWLAGALLFLIRWFFGFLLSVRLKNQAVTMEDKKWLKVVSEESLLLKLNTYDIKVTEANISPMVVGFLHPCIIIPKSLMNSSDKEVRMILLHELYHIKFHDLRYRLLLVCTEALHWVNPLIWKMKSQWIRSEEMRVDESVLRNVDKIAYANLLLKLAKKETCYSTALSASVTPMIRSSILEERIHHILSQRPDNFKGKQRIGRFLKGTLALGLVLGVSTLSVADVSEEKGGKEAALAGDEKKKKDKAADLPINWINIYTNLTEKKPISEVELNAFIKKQVRSGELSQTRASELLSNRKKLKIDLKKHYINHTEFKDLVSPYASEKRFDEGIEWIHSLHFEFCQYTAISSLFIALVENDVTITTEMENRFTDPLLKDAVKKGMAIGLRVHKEEFEASMQKADEITHPNIRRYTIGNGMYWWLNTRNPFENPVGRAAASSWFEQTEILSDKDRSRMMKYLDKPHASQYIYIERGIEEIHRIEAMENVPEIYNEQLPLAKIYLNELLEEYAKLGADQTHPNFLAVKQKLKAL
ncbi:M56 family metallopeptidase [Akkermansiaceae bacterium]|nr:M56 family metallopeptidase [Akkermansiaceae bacterium]